MSYSPCSIFRPHQHHGTCPSRLTGSGAPGGTGYSPSLPVLAFREGGNALVVNLTGDAVTVPKATDPIPAWTSLVTKSS